MSNTSTVFDSIKLLNLIQKYKLKTTVLINQANTYSFSGFYEGSFKVLLDIDINNFDLVELEQHPFIKEFIESSKNFSDITLVKFLKDGENYSVQSFAATPTIGGWEFGKQLTRTERYTSSLPEILANKLEENNGNYVIYLDIKISEDVFIFPNLKFSCSSPDHSRQWFTISKPSDITTVLSVDKQRMLVSFIATLITKISLMESINDKVLTKDLLEYLYFGEKKLSELIKLKQELKQPIENLNSVLYKIKASNVQSNNYNAFDKNTYGFIYSEKIDDSPGIFQVYELFKSVEAHPHNNNFRGQVRNKQQPYSRTAYSLQRLPLFILPQSDIEQAKIELAKKKENDYNRLKKKWDSIYKKLDLGNPDNVLFAFTLSRNFINYYFSDIFDLPRLVNFERDKISTDEIFLFEDILGFSYREFFNLAIPTSYITAIPQLKFNYVKTSLYYGDKGASKLSNAQLTTNITFAYLMENGGVMDFLFPWGQPNIRRKQSLLFNRHVPKNIIILNDLTIKSWKTKARDVLNRVEFNFGNDLLRGKQQINIHIVNPENSFELLKFKRILKLRDEVFLLSELVAKLPKKEKAVKTEQAISRIIGYQVHKDASLNRSDLYINSKSFDAAKYLFINFKSTKKLFSMFGNIDLKHEDIIDDLKFMVSLVPDKKVIALSQSNFNKLKEVAPGVQLLENYLLNPNNFQAFKAQLNKFILVDFSDPINRNIISAAGLYWEKFWAINLNLAPHYLPFATENVDVMTWMYNKIFNRLEEETQNFLFVVFKKLMGFQNRNSNNASRYQLPQVLKYVPKKTDVSYKVFKNLEGDYEYINNFNIAKIFEDLKKYHIILDRSFYRYGSLSSSNMATIFNEFSDSAQQNRFANSLQRLMLLKIAQNLRVRLEKPTTPN